MSKNSNERMVDAMTDLVRNQAVCAPLYSQTVPRLENPLVDMFEFQKRLQDLLAANGRAINLETATFTEKVKDISVQWRNLTLEFAELLERLPYKEWKTYTTEQRELTEDELLEVKYEYIDMFHFFLNIGLCLGIDGVEFEKLFVTKNNENFERQNRGY